MPQSTTDLSPLCARLRATLPDADLAVQALPDLPSLRLALLQPDFPTGPLPADVMRDVIASPAYWAFCWGSGLALARYLRAHPALVQGRSVLDVGSGSGVAAIAAAQAGATTVWACDTDADARLASTTNAALNGVDLRLLQDLDHLPRRVDVALLADVLYDATNLPLLQQVAARAERVIVADSRIQRLPDSSYVEFARLHALTFPNLGEFDEFSTTRLFERRGS